MIKAPFTIDHGIPLAARLIICAIAFSVAALPLALQDNLLLVDYPEHLAHFYLRYNLETTPALQKYYTLSDGHYPYWGIRLVVAALTPVVGLESALKWFTISAALMPAVGACVFGWVLAGRVTLTPLFSLFFVYNSILDLGFINYLFCAGLALLFLAAWVASCGLPLPARCVGLAAAALVLIWMHPLAAALLGAMLCLWEVAIWLSIKNNRKSVLRTLLRLVSIAVAFLPALASIYLLTSFQSPVNVTGLGDIASRARNVLSPFWMGHSYISLTLGVLPLLIIGILVWQKTLLFAPGVGRFVLYMVILAYVTPAVLFGVFYVAMRIPTLALMIGCAGLMMNCATRPPVKRILLVMMLLLGAKNFTVYGQLKDQASAVTELRQASSVIPNGSRVLMAIGRSESDDFSQGKQTNYGNIDSYLVVDKNALVANIFGSVGIKYQPLYLPQTKYLAEPVPFNMLTKTWAEWSDREQYLWSYTRNWNNEYDYILLVSSSATINSLHDTILVHRGTFFSLLKLR